MKKNFTHAFIVCLIITQSAAFKPAEAQSKAGGKITISGAFALYPLAVKWAEEYKKINANVKIDISAGGAGKGMTDVLNGMVDIGMVSRKIYPEEIAKGGLAIAVARDAVVPVMSAKNPAVNEILATGLKKEAGRNIWITGTNKTWSDAFQVKSRAPIHVYTRSDACGAAEVWANYFGKKQEDLLGSGVYGDPGLALAVKNDPVGIGFNNIGYAYDYKTKKQVEGIRVIPLDLNGNGKIDKEENFYNTMNDLVDAISVNKYPSPPARDLYFVTKGKPLNKAAADFLIWVLTDGQKFVHETGFIGISKDRLQKETARLK